MSNLIFRHYKNKKVNILAVYSRVSRKYLFFDNVTADVLSATLENRDQDVLSMLMANDISEEEYKMFLKSFNSKISETTVGDEGVKKEIASEERKIYDELYAAGFLYAFHFDVTKNCNLRCKHCYHPFSEYNLDNDLRLEEIKVLFSTLKELGVFKMTLSGGEPLLRPDLEEILAMADDCGFICDVYSNSTLVNEENVKMLKRHNVSMLSFSCYGYEKSSAEITGCRDFYKRLQNAIKICTAEDMLYELKYPVTKENIHEIKSFREYCKNKQIKLSFEICLTPKLNGQNDNLQCKISAEDYKSMILENADIMLYDALKHDSDEKILCSAGKLSLYGNHKGEIYPCVSYRKKLGDYTELKKIWDDIYTERILPIPKHSDYPSFGTHSYCKYCYEICPALSMLENGSYGDCENSGCEIAKIVEEIHLAKNKTDML